MYRKNKLMYTPFTGVLVTASSFQTPGVHHELGKKKIQKKIQKGRREEWSGGFVDGGIKNLQGRQDPPEGMNEKLIDVDIIPCHIFTSPSLSLSLYLYHLMARPP